MPRVSAILFLLLCCFTAQAAEVTDSTGRVVTVPDHIARVVPAGPPAAVLLAALAPDLMVGWPGPVPAGAAALLDPRAAARPSIPRLTGRDDVSASIKALKPDLILDYGGVSPRYFDLANKTQANTGVPTLLFNGALDEIPRVLRTLGGVLHREERAEALAVLAEAMLTLPPVTAMHPRVVYARGADGLSVAAPGTDVTEVFAHLGWTVLAPEGQGTFRPATIEAIRALDPDRLIFSDPAMREGLVRDPAWQTVRAVREGHAAVAPAAPFGWVEEPPSINRLLGLAWLGGHDPAALAALFNAATYDRALSPETLAAVLAGVPAIKP